MMCAQREDMAEQCLAASENERATTDQLKYHLCDFSESLYAKSNLQNIDFLL